MASALDVLNIARQQIGFYEGPNNENPYGLWYGVPNQPYCAIGVSWCFGQVGLSHLIAAQSPKGFCYNPVALHWFQLQEMIVSTRDMQPGDLVMFDWNRDGVADHVEIIEAVSSAGLGFTTIGFNTGNPNDPTREGCWRVHRNYLFVIAVIRPKYPTVIQPKKSPITTKKATAAVAGVGTAATGGMLVTHPGTVATTTPVAKASTVFVSKPFPTSSTAFIVGATGNGVITVEKGLQKLGLLPSNYVPQKIDAQAIAALAKFEKTNPALGEKNGKVNQLVYDVLKSKL